MYGKSSKSKNQGDSINTLNCSSMDTWNTGSSLKKPANGWENGFNSYGNAPNVDPRMSMPAIPNPADADQTMQYYHYMQYMQVMQMKAAAAYSTNPLGIGLNPLENLPSVNAQPSYSLAAQLPGMPPGRPRPQVNDPRSYPAGKNDGGGIRRDNGTGGGGGASGNQRNSLTKSTLTYGEYKRQQEMLNNPNMMRNSPNNDGWDNPPRSSQPNKSNAPPVDDWDDEPTPSAAKKPMRKSYAAPVDDWDDTPTSSKPQKSNAQPIDDWNDEPTPAKLQRKPQGDPWDEPPASSSKPNRSNAAPKDDWDDEPIAKKKPVIDDWDDEPAPQSSRAFSHSRSTEPVDDWEDASPAPSRGGGRDSYDRGSYRGRGGSRGGSGGGSRRAIERREGDWDCKDCGKNNFQWRKECHKCGTAGGNPDTPSRSSRGGYSRGRDRYNRGSRDSSQSSDHHAAAKDDWDDEGSVKSNGSGGHRGGFKSNKRRYEDVNRGPPKRHDKRDTQSLGDDWDDEPIKGKASKMPPVPVDGWDDEPVSAPKKHAPSKTDDWDDDKGPRSPSPERVRRRRRASPSDDKYRRLEIELKLQRLENERLKLAFSGRRIGMTPSPPRSPSPEYEPVSRRRRHSPKEENSKWESRRYRDSSVERSSSSHRRRATEDETKSSGSSKSSSHKSRHSERVEPEVKSVKPSDTHMMIRGSVTSAALPRHELKKLPNYAHLYNLPTSEVQEVENEVPVICDLKNRTKKDKKSRWSNQPARKVEVVALDVENWDDVDIADAEVPEEISKEPKANDEDNWDDEIVPENIKKEANDNKSSEQDETEDNKKSSSETSEQKDSWDEDDKSPASNEKSQDSSNQGPKKIDADFLGQQIAVQIEKIRHRQAILVQQHINTQVLQSGRIIPPKSPPIIIEKLGATIVDDIYDVSMPPPLIISADAIINSDVSPIESVILAQAIQITNKKRGFESIALAPVVHQRFPVVAAAPTEIIDLVDTSEVIVNSREGIEVSRPTYGLLRKTIPVKQIKNKNQLEENWDDDDEDSKPPQKVDLNALSSALKVDDLLQVVSDEENWEDDQDEEVKEKPKSKKYEKSSRKKDEKSHKSRSTKKGSDNDNWDDEETNQDYHQVDPDILARHMAEFAAGTTKSKKSENTKSFQASSAIVDEDENWDDDPELDAASKKLIDPEILAKNVQLHNSMDSGANSVSGNKIEPLEDTCESFRKEFGNREKSKVIKALSTMPTSVASLPVSAAIAAYTAQKRKLSEQAYEYQPRREWADPRKHPDPYSYPPADYIIPVDYGRVPQPHPTHYGTQFDYKNYYKSLYLAPTKEKSAPVTSKPKVKQLKGELSVNKKKTVVEVEKKKKLELNAEDLSDGEIVDSEEDFGSDINSENEDDDVIEIPVKVDLVDLTEEEMAAAVKEESETVNIKKESVFIPPMPTEIVEVPKPPEIEDSPESPVNMEVNEDPEEWHEEQKTQEDSPASPENMDVTEDQQESPDSPVNQDQESPASPVNQDQESPASPVNQDQETPMDVMTSEQTPKDIVIENSPASPVNIETEVTTDVLEIEESKGSQLDDEVKAPECVIASDDNQIEESPASPANKTIEESPASPNNKETETSEDINVPNEALEDNEPNSSSVHIEDNIVIKEVLEEVVAVNEDFESHEEMVIETSPDCPVKEDSEEIPAESSPSSPVKEFSEESSSSPAESDSPNNEAQPEEIPSEKITSLTKDPVEVNDEKLPEQLEITSDLTEASLEYEEPVTISPTEIPADENSSENHEKPETPKKDTQETEEPSKLVEVPTESDSEMDDDDILLDDDELEAAALFLKNEEKEKVIEVKATTSSNEIQEASVEIPVTLNGFSIKDDVRFNPYILIKKEKVTDFPGMVVKVPGPIDPDSDIEEVPVTETPESNRRSGRIRQSSRK